VTGRGRRAQIDVGIRGTTVGRRFGVGLGVFLVNLVVNVVDLAFAMEHFGEYFVIGREGSLGEYDGGMAGNCVVEYVDLRGVGHDLKGESVCARIRVKFGENIGVLVANGMPLVEGLGHKFNGTVSGDSGGHLGGMFNAGEESRFTRTDVAFDGNNSRSGHCGEGGRLR